MAAPPLAAKNEIEHAYKVHIAELASDIMDEVKAQQIDNDEALQEAISDASCGSSWTKDINAPLALFASGNWKAGNDYVGDDSDMATDIVDHMRACARWAIEADLSEEIGSLNWSDYQPEPEEDEDDGSSDDSGPDEEETHDSDGKPLPLPYGEFGVWYDGKAEVEQATWYQYSAAKDGFAHFSTLADAEMFAVHCRKGFQHPGYFAGKIADGDPTIPSNPDKIWGIWIVDSNPKKARWVVDGSPLVPIFFEDRDEAIEYQKANAFPEPHYAVRRNNVPASNYDKPTATPVLVKTKTGPAVELFPSIAPWGIWYQDSESDSHEGVWCHSNGEPHFYPTKAEALKGAAGFGMTGIDYSVKPVDTANPTQPLNAHKVEPVKAWGVWFTSGEPGSGVWCGQGEQPLGKYPTKEAAENVHSLLAIKGHDGTYTVHEWSENGPPPVKPEPVEQWGVWCNAENYKGWCSDDGGPGHFFDTAAAAVEWMLPSWREDSEYSVILVNVETEEPIAAEEPPLVAPVTEKAAKEAEIPKAVPVFGLWWEGFGQGWKAMDEDDQPGWYEKPAGTVWKGTKAEAVKAQQKLGSQFHVAQMDAKPEWGGYAEGIEKWGVWFERSNSIPDESPGWCGDNGIPDVFATYAEALAEADKRINGCETDRIYPWPLVVPAKAKKTA